MLRATGVLTLKDGFAECAEGMQAYFDELNDERKAEGEPPVNTHEPVLYDYCTKPVLLKP